MRHRLGLVIPSGLFADYQTSRIPSRRIKGFARFLRQRSQSMFIEAGQAYLDPTVPVVWQRQWDLPVDVCLSPMLYRSPIQFPGLHDES